MTTLLLADHDNSSLRDATTKALSAARALGGWGSRSTARGRKEEHGDGSGQPRRRHPAEVRQVGHATALAARGHPADQVEPDEQRHHQQTATDQLQGAHGPGSRTTAEARRKLEAAFDEQERKAAEALAREFIRKHRRQRADSSSRPGGKVVRIIYR